MAEQDIDDVDRAILHALQEDARNMSSGDIAERTGPPTALSASASSGSKARGLSRATVPTSTTTNPAIRSG
jgi:DNA-binding Lrp family transcriptional regulator